MYFLLGFQIIHVKILHLNTQEFRKNTKFNNYVKSYLCCSGPSFGFYVNAIHPLNWCVKRFQIHSTRSFAYLKKKKKSFSISDENALCVRANCLPLEITGAARCGTNCRCFFIAANEKQTFCRKSSTTANLHSMIVLMGGV